MAGEKSGSLSEVLDRFITYQKLSLAVKKRVIVSLMYPSILIFLTLGLMVFLVTYVVPNFAQLYTSMQAQLPRVTVILIAIGTTARSSESAFARRSNSATASSFLPVWNRKIAYTGLNPGNPDNRLKLCSASGIRPVLYWSLARLNRAAPWRGSAERARWNCCS